MDARDSGWAAAAAGGAPGGMRAAAAAADEAHRGSGGGSGGAAASSFPPHALFAPPRDVPGMLAHAAAAADDAVGAADAHRRNNDGSAVFAAAHFSAPSGLPPLAPLATDVFMHDAAAPPPPEPPEPPEALLGRRVRCVFDDTGPVEGVIVSVHRTAAYGTLWRVRYSDGEEEELLWCELRGALQPADEAAARDATPVPSDDDDDDDAPPQFEAPAPQHRAAPRAPSAAAAPASDHSPQRQQSGGGGANVAHTGAPLPMPPPDRQFKGVYSYGGSFTTEYRTNGQRAHVGGFRTEEEAARAYDDEMRALGCRVVNFPRPGSGEVQAVRHEAHSVTLQRAQQRAPAAHTSRAAETMAAAAAAARVGNHHERRYRYVRREQSAAGTFYRAEFYISDDVRIPLGHFRTAEDAARALDAQARKRGLLHRLSFPQTDAERAAVAAWLAQPLRARVTARLGASYS
jgi:hypothetical protein